MTPIIAGNWKMNLSKAEAVALANRIHEHINSRNAQSLPRVVLCVPALYLSDVHAILKNSSVEVFAQHLHFQPAGAFTGEWSAEMLVSVGAQGSLIAHSERRQYHTETDEQAAARIAACLRAGITPLYCCGELKEERLSGRHREVVEEQLTVALFGLEASDARKLIIAYEPVWAIGTGLTATAEQAGEIHSHIRFWLSRRFDEQTANAVPILYGGSMKPVNAPELLSTPNVNGGLIGGASLHADDFIALIEAASRQ